MSDREEFKDWLKDEESEPCGKTAWEAWQAATASMQAKLDALEAENARLKAALTAVSEFPASTSSAYMDIKWLQKIARDALKGE